MLGHTDLKKGVVIQVDGAPHQVVDSSHIAMGRGGAVMRTKLKNLLSGALVEKSFRAADKIEPADIHRVNLQFLYHDGSGWHFMNSATYDQETFAPELIGDFGPYLVEGAKVVAQYWNGRAIAIDPGNNVWLKVVQTEPGLKGDTATTTLKPATLETGLRIMVPLFIGEGDVVKVDTRTGAYLERQK